MSVDSFYNTELSQILLNNSIKSIFSATATLQKHGKSKYYTEEGELRSGVTTVVTAIEVILKSKLAFVDWKLIFTDIKKANYELALKAEFKSVNISNAIKELKLHHIPITLDQISTIEKLNNVRNKIVHAHHDENNNKYCLMISEGINVYLELLSEYFPNFDDTDNSILNIGKKLKDVPEFVTIRLKTLKKAIFSIPKPITYHFSECPDCLQDVYILKDEKTAICTFCNHEVEIYEMAKTHSIDNCELKPCEKCSCGIMALHEIGEHYCWQCVICGYYINKPQIWITKHSHHIYSDNSIRDEYKVAKEWIIGLSQRGE